MELLSIKFWLCCAFFLCFLEEFVAISIPTSSKKAQATATKDRLVTDGLISAEGKKSKLKSESEAQDVKEFSVSDMIGQIVTSTNALDHLEKMKAKLLKQFDDKNGTFSTARNGYGGYGAHGFPSLEGALLSIAFLTFSVFLIDFIQQLLSRFRYGSGPFIAGRKRREVAFPEDESSPLAWTIMSHILKSIDNPLWAS